MVGLVVYLRFFLVFEESLYHYELPSKNLSLVLSMAIFASTWRKLIEGSKQISDDFIEQLDLDLAVSEILGLNPFTWTIVFFFLNLKQFELDFPSLTINKS